jgi:hypothetical protein
MKPTTQPPLDTTKPSTQPPQGSVFQSFYQSACWSGSNGESLRRRPVTSRRGALVGSITHQDEGDGGVPPRFWQHNLRSDGAGHEEEDGKMQPVKSTRHVFPPLKPSASAVLQPSSSLRSHCHPLRRR